MEFALRSVMKSIILETILKKIKISWNLRQGPPLGGGFDKSRETMKPYP